MLFILLKLLSTFFICSLLNDCHSLLDYINFEQKNKLYDINRTNKLEIISSNSELVDNTISVDNSIINSKKTNLEYESIITQLENEKFELISKLKILSQTQTITTRNEADNTSNTNIETLITINQEDHLAELKDLKVKLEQSQQAIDLLRDQLVQGNTKLNEMTSLYETTKQSEVDEKNKIKHLERSVRALKIEKDQLFAQISDLQERVNLQAKDLQEAQNQRKLAVQEFTDVNEKVNELRSKNAKLSNDLLNKEDEVEDLKRYQLENKLELERRDKLIDELRHQMHNYTQTIARLEKEKLDIVQSELKSSDDKPAEPAVDESLKELNTELAKEIKLLQMQITSNTAQIAQLEEANASLLNELQQIKEKNAQLNRETTEKFQEQLADAVQSKEKEISFLHTESSRQIDEIEKLNASLAKLHAEKKALEDEVALFNESKQAMSKYDWQMNEILQMVNEEKVVRGHLRSLASKLIEEVDTLRSQTANGVGQLALANAASINGTNTAGWKNRCSEKRDRINVQNMQLALDKEFAAKEALIEENNSLKQELDVKQHKIYDLQSQIDQINKDLVKNQTEIQDLRDDLLYHQKALVTAGVSSSSNSRQLQNSSSASNNTNDTGMSSSSHPNKLNGTSMSNQSASSVTTNSNGTSGVVSNPIYTIDDTLVTDEIYDPPSSISVDSKTAELANPVIKLNQLQPAPQPDNKHANSPQIGSNSSSRVQHSNSVHASPATLNSAGNGHRFEVVSFQTIERCEYCCGILYGICRQAVNCKEKNCNYLCHPKCRQFLPSNCPININQRVQLKGVDFTRGIGTLMQGHLKVPKQGGVKKGWQDHYVFLSNARLFVCPIVDNKPSLIPSLIVDIRDPQFSVSSVQDSDVIHASKRDIPCIFKMIVSKLKNPQSKHKLLFCAKDEKDKNNWINVLKDLNERLIQGSKTSANSSSILLPIEAKEVCDATPIRNAVSACVYDSERLLIASDEGIDVIDIKTDCTLKRFHDKKTFSIDVFREEKLIVAISGKHHQIFLFPTIIVEGMETEPLKIEETKGCNLFCIGKLISSAPSPIMSPTRADNMSASSTNSSIYASSIRLLCVAVKKVVHIYEISSSPKPKYKKLRDIELTMMVQSMQIINNQLCIGFQSEFALYSLAQENAPIALLQPDKDESLKFLIKDPINALMAVQISNEEYLLVFENLGVYVNINGCRSRIEEIMWPSKPLHVAYTEPFLLCFCDRGVDVFHVRTSEWIQIIQFPKTKPLDKAGALCLCNESQDSIRLIHLKAIGEEEILSLLTKNRSLIKTKYRKGSLSRADETHLSLSNSTNSTINQGPPIGGSTALNYSNSNASSSGASQSNSTSRKSLISNPINFQHIKHMGPSDGKTYLTTDNQIVNSGLPPISSTRVVNVNNSSVIETNTNTQPKKSTSTSGVRQIAKNEISAPTNFRHVVRGLDVDNSSPQMLNTSTSSKDVTQKSQSPTHPLNKTSSQRLATNPLNSAQLPPQPISPQLPNITTTAQQQSSAKSSSLSSSSSSSSSILHSPNSPSSSNNENLSQAISNTLKASSVLYNGKLLDINSTNS